MIRTVTRDTGHALARVFNYTVISAISTGAEVTSNLTLAVLRYCIIIFLALKASHNTAFLRVNINIIILII